MKRKFLAAREDLVNKVSEIAQRKNVTLFGMINAALEELIKSEETGQNLHDIVDNQLIIKMAKEAGFTITTENLWNYALDKIFEKDNEALNEMWHTTGQWFGKYCKVRFPNDDPLAIFERIIRTLFWNISEVNAIQNSGEVTITCIGSRIPYSYTVLLSAFIIGFMESFSYLSHDRSLSKGIISLAFKRGE